MGGSRCLNQDPQNFWGTCRMAGNGSIPVLWAYFRQVNGQITEAGLF